MYLLAALDITVGQSYNWQPIVISLCSFPSCSSYWYQLST